MAVERARKKPVEIEFILWDGTNAGEIETWIGDDFVSWIPSKEQIEIRTLEGPLFASKGDRILRGVNREHYPCKPDVFPKIYDIIT